MKPIFLQLFAFNDVNLIDIEGIRAAAKLGYQGVELLSDPSEAVIETLKETGMLCRSTHGFEIKDGYAANEKMLHRVGISYLKTGDELNFGTREETLRKAEEINRLGKNLKSQGFALFYHNHTHEWEKAGDKYLMDILLENTDPEYCCLQLDCGYAAGVGVDIPEFFSRYADRIKLLHIKPVTLPMTPDTVWFLRPGALPELPPIGEPMPQVEAGKMESTMKYLIESNGPMSQCLGDYSAILPMAAQYGCQHFAVDRDHGYGSGIYDNLREDLEFIRSIEF